MVRTDRVGDVVLSTPVLEALKSHFPESSLSMMVSSYAADVVKSNPHLDDVIVDRPESGFGGFFMLVKELRRKRFEVGILLRPTFRLAFMLFLAGVKYRIGTGYRLYQLLFNRRVYEHRKVNLRHEAEYNLSLLRPLGIATRGIAPRIYLSPEEEQFAQRIFDEFGIVARDTVIAMHAGSGDSSLNLPPKRFAEAGDQLVEKLAAKLILTGTEEERGLVELVKRKMVRPSFDLVGGTSLRQLAAVLKRCDAMVSNSTGPMHLASAVGTPTVAIFCPIFTAGPIRWGPYGDGHEVILPPVPVCFKCRPNSCPHYDCMEKIKAEQIVSRVGTVLKRRESSEKVETSE